MNLFSALRQKLAGIRTELNSALAALKITVDDKLDEKGLLASLTGFATKAATELTDLRAQLGAALTKAGGNLVEGMSLKDMVTALAAKVGQAPAAAAPDPILATLKNDLISALKELGITAKTDATLTDLVKELATKATALETELGETQASLDEKATAMATEQMAQAGFKPVAVKGATPPGQAGKSHYETYASLTGAAQAKYYRDNKAAIIASWPKNKDE